MLALEPLKLNLYTAATVVANMNVAPMMAHTAIGYVAVKLEDAILINSVYSKIPPYFIEERPIWQSLKNKSIHLPNLSMVLSGNQQYIKYGKYAPYVLKNREYFERQLNEKE